MRFQRDALAGTSAILRGVNDCITCALALVESKIKFVEHVCTRAEFPSEICWLPLPTRSCRVLSRISLDPRRGREMESGSIDRKPRDQETIKE